MRGDRHPCLRDGASGLSLKLKYGRLCRAAVACVFERKTLETVEAMVEDYLWSLRDNLDMPFAFYGHSLGGLVAFEMARRLEAEGLPSPEHLFIGASAPPHFGLIHSRIGHLSGAEFVDAVQERYAGIPAPVLNEPELMELLLPVLRADFSAYEDYEFANTALLRCPVTVFAGSEDRGISEEMMIGWEQHTRADLRCMQYREDHFFLTTSKEHCAHDYSEEPAETGNTGSGFDDWARVRLKAEEDRMKTERGEWTLGR